MRHIERLLNPEEIQIQVLHGTISEGKKNEIVSKLYEYQHNSGKSKRILDWIKSKQKS